MKAKKGYCRLALCEGSWEYRRLSLGLTAGKEDGLCPSPLNIRSIVSAAATVLKDATSTVFKEERGMHLFLRVDLIIKFMKG